MADVEVLGTDAADVGGLILHRTAFLSAATILVAAFGLSGCAPEPAPAGPTSTRAAPSSPAAPAPPELPQPSALIDVLVTLTDPRVPGTDKLVLVEGAGAEEAPGLEAFATALADNGMLPLEFSVTDVAWSQRRPQDVTANVTLTPPDPETGVFSFPMEFTPLPSGGWQLSRRTAEELLALGAP
ncbi:hypothetical protein [Mycolicibacterium palauense]|uniref:hypothetical protein n=1 Tax=Mycolicibacterium palauense TaxID=2034511 RepID=UPI001FEA4E9A|nr:hypothetical protein [Mycolicibacterium palauense]